MSKTVEKALLSQNWTHKMFYVMLHDHFKELQKYRNLQFLVKISPKITFYIVREYYLKENMDSKYNFVRKIRT